MKLITCKIKGHKFIALKKENSIKEYECCNCKQKFTTDGYGQIVKLNSYWKENNLLFQQIIERQNEQAQAS